MRGINWIPGLAEPTSQLVLRSTISLVRGGLSKQKTSASTSLGDFMREDLSLSFCWWEKVNTELIKKYIN